MCRRTKPGTHIETEHGVAKGKLYNSTRGVASSVFFALPMFFLICTFAHNFVFSLSSTKVNSTVKEDMDRILRFFHVHKGNDEHSLLGELN